MSLVSANDLHKDYIAGDVVIPAIRGVSFSIESSSFVCFVGPSGSGKTTLVKLLLGFYPPSKGNISVGNVPLTNIDHNFWRRNCGAVMQDGFIFSDTIAKNIALGEQYINSDQLLYASRMACIDDFIDQLPLGYNTRI